jgi:ABC-type phosphate/phosphonate transport system ATPase subunit
MTLTSPHLQITDLGFQRNGRWLFRHVEMQLTRGCVIAIVGPSGVGKTSLLSCLSGLLTPSEGSVRIWCNGGCEHSPGEYQSKLGIVFQHLALSRNSTVLNNVLCGRLARYRWWRTLSGFPRHEKVAAYARLAELDLTQYAHRRTAEISGGEQQRTALLRALFQEPECILVDEPVSQLDTALATRALSLLRREARQHSRTVLCVLHDLSLVERFADFVMRLDPHDPEHWEFIPNAAAVFAS